MKSFHESSTVALCARTTHHGPDDTEAADRPDAEADRDSVVQVSTVGTETMSSDRGDHNKAVFNMTDQNVGQALFLRMPCWYDEPSRTPLFMLNIF